MDEKIVKRLWRKYQAYDASRTVKNAKAFYLALINQTIDPAAICATTAMTYIEFVTAIGMAAGLEEEGTENVDA